MTANRKDGITLVLVLPVLFWTTTAFAGFAGKDVILVLDGDAAHLEKVGLFR